MGLREKESTQAPHVERAVWSADAEQGLSLTLQQDLQWMRQEVEKGIAQLWRINQGALWVVTRGELDELVLCCVQGKGLHDFMPFLINQARKQGFKTMRCHTDRKGLLRALQRYGVRQREVVLELTL